LPSHERSLRMDQSQVWGRSRYATLLVVLGLHVAILAVLLRAPGPPLIAELADEPVQLLFIPPPVMPKIRAENAAPRRLRGDTSISVAQPEMHADTALAPAGSGTQGNGAGVDWAAEARRALQAFEIRKHQPPSNNTVSRTAAEENWWPQAPHHAGDQFKAPNGDWVVWVNESCYQLASSAANPTVPGAAPPPPTICVGDGRRQSAQPTGNP
jgi:hypothetical protein